MVITDKKAENTSETETKKNRKKRILIGLAVLVGIGILNSIISSKLNFIVSFVFLSVMIKFLCLDGRGSCPML